jgi:hypothetical protein
MPYDFPTSPATGTVVTVPDGSYRVWDSTKWRASPSANVIIPPTGFLPLAGGNVSGILNLVDPSGGININRNIAWSGTSTDAANHSFTFLNTITGTNLDPPTAGAAIGSNAVTLYNGFNTGSLGTRGWQFWSQVGPGSIGRSFNALVGSVSQVALGTFAPGTNTWAPNTAYALNYAMTNNLSYYVATQAGTSASSGTGPSGYGSAIADGTVVWSYQGPGVPRYWATGTSYATRGELVCNPNNGGLFRVETPGTSGASPGPVIPTIANGVPTNAVPDGSVIWSYKGPASAATQQIGLTGSAQANFNAGGKSITETFGQQWGAIISASATANATYYGASVGLEIDDNWAGGPIRKLATLQIARIGGQGVFTDIGVAISGTRAAATSRYKQAMVFTNAIDINQGYGVVFEGSGLAGRQHMAGAIDMRMVNADGTTGQFGNGFLLRHFNGQLDNNGAWQLRYGSIAPTSTGLAIDVSNVELQSIAITSGGANWTLNSWFKGSDGSYGQVHTVDNAGGAGIGAILTVSLILPSQVPSASRPSAITLSPFNPDTTVFDPDGTPLAGPRGPSGDVIWPTPATGTPTYAAPTTPTLSLMPSGGTTVFGGPVNYTATGGTVARSAQDRAADVANVLDYGADPLGVVDSSTAFNAAAAHISPATGRRVSVYVPSGKYRINQQVILTDGQSLMGDGAGATMLYISEQLNPTATSVIKLTTSVTDPGPVISDIMMWFEQPIDATSRATFKTLAAGGTSHNGGTGVQYPWAIATDTLNVRISVRNVSIAGSWNGIEANKAVFWIDGLKICSFNIGISMGGTAAVPVGDWAHLSDIEFWVFGLNTTALQNIYMDGQTIAMQIGAQNGLTGQNISCFTSRLVFTTDAGGGWFSFTNLAMDTDQATIEVANCGWLQITNLYTTSGTNAVRPLVSIAGGGRAIITNWYGHNSSPHQMLSVSGGDVTLVGAFLLPYDSTSDVVSVLSTGTLRMSNSKIYPTGSGAWTRPVINQYDTSRLQVNDIDVIGDATSGTAVQFNTDQTGNRCGNIAVPTGWRRLYAPVGSGLGRYGDVFLAPTDSTSMQVGSFGFLRLGATTHSSTAFGDRAMDQHADTGSNNTAMGFLAGYNVGSGTYNCFFGSVSGFASSAPMTGNANSCFGAVSGQNLSSGTNNTFIGANAGASVTTGSGNIVIGSGQGTPAAGSSNTINIGGVFTGSGINTPATSIATIPGTLIVGGPITVATGGPTIRAGTGAATGTQPKGSMWMRTDGAVGSTLYVTQGGGTWAAVAGV